MKFRVAVLAAVAAVTGLPADAQPASNWVAPFSPDGRFDSAPPNTVPEAGEYPAAASVVVLPDGRILYWDGIAGLEDRNYPIAFDAGGNKEIAGSRVLDLSGPEPAFSDALEVAGDDMFCSDQRMLPDGRVVVVGGNRYVSEPVETEGDLRPVFERLGQPTPDGTGELTGSDDIRMFDPADDTWTSLDDNPTFSEFALLHDPTTRASEDEYPGDKDLRLYRWYPSSITMSDGRILVVSGVDRVISNTQGVTVHESEVFDPSDGSVRLLPESADYSLPMYPRLRLLPSGHVFYDGSGQMWGPGGQSADQALWNVQAAFDPSSQSWAPTGMSPLGARSGTWTVMLPLTPDSAGNYGPAAQILSGGGTLGTSPGGYIANNLVEKITVGPGADGITSSTELVSPSANRRWFSSAVLLPSGEVFVTSGADSDHVVMPGTEASVREAEIYNPATDTWRSAGSVARDRGYHNSAVLLPDGSVLIGGNSPINAYYDAKSRGDIDDLPVGARSNNLKDPSFEIYRPDYMDGDRPDAPVVVGQESADNPVLPIGGDVEVETDADRFLLVRSPAATHTIDADQRTVELAKATDGGSTTLSIPDATVTPPGMYYLFALDSDGIPSVANIVFVR